MNKKKCPLCGAVKTKKTNGVFRLLRGSPSRILRNPQQGDFRGNSYHHFSSLQNDPIRRKIEQALRENVTFMWL